ncbi:hypothetical protein GUJ93_ZPchr0008g12533 [Zizania palustris]|uniref:Uncharacterized protein n=1 Tax=Zizania palustris TaxID=103762 RepID=A0A8J5V5A6_ZIZPA|nr:hypothetical protein GUJ93_ZPchr0008g12533 [Zizania palustris]
MRRKPADFPTEYLQPQRGQPRTASSAPVSRADGLLGLLDSSASPLYGLSSGDVIIQKCGGGGTAFAL